MKLIRGSSSSALRAGLRRAAKSALLHNVVSLYGTQTAAYIFPLMTIPYLARVLGASAWGKVAFAQAFGAYLMLFIEFGFNLSATRDVARQRDNREGLSRILGGVLGAKLLLTAFCLLLAAMCGPWMPIFREDPRLLYMGALSGIAQAFSMAWFFQGLERMKLPSALDVISRAVGTFGVFVWVRRPEDGWRVLLIQALASSLGAATLLVLCYREIPFRLPSWTDTRNAIRKGAGMFLFRSAASLYTIGNALILGFLAPATSVGYYTSAEKLSKAVLGMTSPITQTLFPRLTHLVRSSHVKAAKLIKFSVWVMIGCSATATVVLWILAPWIIRTALGPGFGPAIPVFRILSLLVPAIAVSGVLGINWMLPLGLDRPFNKIIIFGGLLNVCLAAGLARSMAQVGMALAVVTSESIITVAMFVYLHSRKLSPLHSPESLANSLNEIFPVAVK